MKRILWFTLLLALLLSACSSKGTEPVVVKSPTPQKAPTQTVTEITVQAATPAPGLVAAEPGCTVVSPYPTPGPTIVAAFPNPTEADWRRGPKTAAVTIMEYSDFQ